MSSKNSAGTNKRRAARAVGASSAMGAFLAFGITPLTAAPARAEGFDDILEAIFGQASTWFDPGAFESSVADFGALFGGDVAGSAEQMVDPLQGLDDFVANAINTVIYQPLHGLGESLINGGFTIDGVFDNGADAYVSFDDDGDLIYHAATSGGFLFGDGGSGSFVNADGDLLGADGSALTDD